MNYGRNDHHSVRVLNQLKTPALLRQGLPLCISATAVFRHVRPSGSLMKFHGLFIAIEVETGNEYLNLKEAFGVEVLQDKPEGAFPAISKTKKF